MEAIRSFHRAALGAGQMRVSSSRSSLKANRP